MKLNSVSTISLNCAKALYVYKALRQFGETVNVLTMQQNGTVLSPGDSHDVSDAVGFIV